MSFRPVDAAYSLTLDRLILISANPNQLHIYDPVAQADQTVALPAAPQNVSLAPDGTHAAVSFATALAYIDLQSAAITNYFPNIPVGAGIVICGSAWLYVFPGIQGNALSVNLSTGQTATSATYVNSASGGIFDPAVNAIYSTEDGISPDSLTRYDVSGGVVGAITNDPAGYSGVLSICGPLWLSRDGSMIYSACGTVYRASSDPTKDMRYLGVVPGVGGVRNVTTSDSLGQVAAIPAVPFFAQPPTPLADTVVNIYSAGSLVATGQFATTPFLVNSVSFPAHARWVFYNSSSSSLFVITQADSSAGLQLDFAVENISLTNPNSCGAAFAASSAQAIAPGLYATVQIQSGEDCVFTATSNVPWIVLTSGYYGSGNTALTYLVRPNLSGAARSGTINLGTETFTVNQDAMGPPSALTPLSFKPVAALYAKALDKIVLVSAAPNELHIYDPPSQADQVVPLPYTPLSLSVGPDGLSAAVGYSGAISIVDLQHAVVTQTIPVDMDNGGIALAGNGFAYAFPSQTVSWGNINSVQLATGTLSTLLDTYYGNIPRLDASGNFLYVSGGDGSSKLSISQGAAVLTNAFLNSVGGNIWLSEDKSRLIDSSGQVFFTSTVPGQDLQPDGALSGAPSVDWADESQAQQQIAVLTDPNNGSPYNGLSPSNTFLQIYADQGLILNSQTTLPGFSNSGTNYVSHGRYVFWNAAATQLYAITEADGSSGLLSDFAIDTIAMPEALAACTYTLSPASLNVPAANSNWTISVSSNCSWSPLFSATWLGGSLGPGGGNGNGQISLSVGNNPGSARTGTISVGNQTVTINQVDASCTGALSSSSATFTQSGGSAAVSYVTGPGCPWSIQNFYPWITVSSGLSGTGSATIQYTVAAAPPEGQSQYGQLNIAGLTFGITQNVGPKFPDFAVWRPSSGTWFISPSANPTASSMQPWGLPGDIPVAGDYDGDGRIDFAVWRPSNGTWYIIPTSNPGAPVTQQWGLPGDVPVVGDFDGDGKTDYAVWRPTEGNWYIIPTSNPGAPVVQQWGLPGDLPIAGDFDGDGKTDFAVWRPTEGNWYILPSSSPGTPIVQQWGLPGDIPVPGDFDGDRKTDFAVWRPSNGTWYVIPSSNPTAPIIRQWGLPGDVPLVGDYNQDGRADFVVWRPSSGSWYVSFTAGSYNYPFPDIQQQWGLPGDVPVSPFY